MINTYYENIEGNVSASLNPPPYSEEEPYPLDPSARVLPTLGSEVIAPVPSECQPYYGLPSEGYNPGATLCPSQTIFITTVLPPSVPDYLGYSIFTMVCCFLPLGFAAFIYSKMTQVANNRGDGTAAQQKSRLALILGNTAFGIGLVLWIVSITIVLW